MFTEINREILFGIHQVIPLGSTYHYSSWTFPKSFWTFVFLSDICSWIEPRLTKKQKSIRDSSRKSSKNLSSSPRIPLRMPLFLLLWRLLQNSCREFSEVFYFMRNPPEFLPGFRLNVIQLFIEMFLLGLSGVLQWKFCEVEISKSSFDELPK